MTVIASLVVLHRICLRTSSPHVYQRQDPALSVLIRWSWHLEISLDHVEPRRSLLHDQLPGLCIRSCPPDASVAPLDDGLQVFLHPWPVLIPFFFISWISFPAIMCADSVPTAGATPTIRSSLSPFGTKNRPPGGFLLNRLCVLHPTAFRPFSSSLDHSSIHHMSRNLSEWRTPSVRRSKSCFTPWSA